MSVSPKIWLDVSLKRFHRVDDRLQSSISFRIVSDHLPILVRLEPRDGQNILLAQSQAHVEPKFNHWFCNGIYLAGEESAGKTINLSEPLLYFECRCTIDPMAAGADGEQAKELANAYRSFVQWLAREFHIVYVHLHEQLEDGSFTSKVDTINISERLAGFEQQLNLDIDHMESMQFNANLLCGI